MTTNIALFLKEGDVYTPTRYAHGPWSPELVHGGSTGGLMAYILEQCAPNPEMRMVRTTLDMFRPVPMAPLRAATKVLREGRRLQMVEATLYAEGMAVARSVGVRMKITNVKISEEIEKQELVPDGPEGLHEINLSGSASNSNERLPGLNSNIQIRRLSGFDGKGAGSAWFKAPIAVVEGVENSAFTHLGIISDFGNGLGQLFLPGTMGAINGDINLYLHRNPLGEWLALRSKTIMTETGIGVVNSNIFDTSGLVAQCHQAVMVQVR